MSAQTIPFQAPTSLMGTLAAYEARRRSESTASTTKAGSASHLEVSALSILPPADAIYKRSLPSLHFLRWRPLYHLQASSSWMNDPCAPGFDPTTGLYHLFFQWNPKRNVYGAIAWGSISWGHAISKDMVNWKVSSTAVLKPGSWYDREGCFTGCMVPTSLDGKPGQITLLYTGVSRLPLHHTLPYKNTTETLAIAQSSDGGKSFVKMRGNPVLPQPPSGLDVTGWRDPYVAPWPSMDRLLGQENGKTLYGMISGGIRGRTPTAFLYAVNPEKLTEWIFLNHIINIGINHNISRWSGDMGVNWECGTFMTLTSDVDGSSREFFVFGAEGSDTLSAHSTFTEHPQQQTKFPRAERSLQWMCGSLEATTGPEDRMIPSMKYVAGGRFDHAAMYGVNTFRDPNSGKQTAWGWITEEDLPQRLVDRQNWSGLLSVPRELSLVCIKGVTGALHSKLKAITSLDVEPDSDDTFTVRTLGISPAQSLEVLRKHARYLEITEPKELSMSGDTALDIQTCRFELAAAFSVSDSCAKVGISIHHSEDLDLPTSTQVYLDTRTETMLVERPDSLNVDPEIVTYPEKAPFTLFNRRGADGLVEREQLQIRAFFDESVLEVFVNDRCTFAVRIYPGTKRCWGVRFWADDTRGNTGLIMARSWDGLRADTTVES